MSKSERLPIAVALTMAAACATVSHGEVKPTEDLFDTSYVIGHQILYTLQEQSLRENNPARDCFIFLGAIEETIVRHKGQVRGYAKNESLLVGEYEMPGGTLLTVSIIPVENIQSQTRHEITIAITPAPMAKRRIFHGKIITECGSGVRRNI